MSRNELHRVSVDSTQPYPAPYDPEIHGGLATGCLSLPRPGTLTPLDRSVSHMGLSPRREPPSVEKYRNRRIPGYTGYISGMKFVSMGRSPYAAQALASEQVHNNIVIRDGVEAPMFGRTGNLPSLPSLKSQRSLPNLFPDDHDHITCRPPIISGNPSNKHNYHMGDPRIPGTYSNKTMHRMSYKGPRPGKILHEQSMLELFKTPAERKHAYEIALRRVGKERVKTLLKTISERITGKLGSRTSQAFHLRRKLEFFAGADHMVSIDEFRTMFLSVCGISLDQDNLLALYGILDADGSGFCDMTEMMEGLMDSDYFACYLGRNKRLDAMLTEVTEGDKESMKALLEKIEAIGNMAKVFNMFDANRSGRLSRTEFAMGCEMLNCPLTAAGQEVFWSKCEQDGNDFIDFGEFCQMFASDYKDYIGGNSKFLATSSAAYGLAAPKGPSHAQALGGLLYKEERW